MTSSPHDPANTPPADADAAALPNGRSPASGDFKPGEAGRMGQQSEDAVDRRLTKELAATFPASDPLTVTRAEATPPPSAPSVEDTFKTYADKPREEGTSHAAQAGEAAKGA